MDIGSILNNAVSAAFGPTAIIYALAAIGLNVHFGYTGLLNFGQAGFMAVSAFGLAVAVTTYGLNFWVGIIIGLLAAIVLALVLGLPTLRLRADYLAIATIAAAEILRLIFGSVEFKSIFGGSNGLNGFSKSFQDLNPYSGGLDLGFASWTRNDTWVMTVGWGLIIGCCILLWALMRSPWGRVLRSIREDEEAVRSLGKNVFAYKMQALVLGGFIGGLAGLVLALQQANVKGSDFTTNVTFFAYTCLLLGGAARILGPVVGAMIFWLLISGIGTFFSQATAGNDPLIPVAVMTDIQASLVRFILVGAGLMLLMIFRPQGIFGDRKEIAIDAR